MKKIRKRKIPQRINAYDSKPLAGESEIDKTRTDRIVNQPAFEPFDKPQVGCRFHIFKNKGEQLVGRVIGDPIQNVHRTASWPIELESGEIVEIFGNKSLHKKLRQCVGYVVRIVYIGREHLAYAGHAKKVYRVYRYQGRDQNIVGEHSKKRSVKNDRERKRSG